MSEKTNENVPAAENVKKAEDKNVKMTKSEKIEGLDFEIWLVRHAKILFSHKKTIAVVTAICLVIGLLLSVFVMKPLYASEAKFLVKIPLNFETPYGIFIFPSQNLSEYTDIGTGTRALKITYDDLKSKYSLSDLGDMIKVSIKSGVGLINFSIMVKTGDPAESARIADIHMQNYLDLINFSFRRIAVNTFLEVKKREMLISAKSLTEFNKNLEAAKASLAGIPSTIILENALLDKNQAALYAAGKTGTDLSQFKDHILLTQAVNPKYDSLTRLMSQIELDRNNAKNLMELASKDVEYLTAQKNEIEQSRLNNTKIESPEDGLNFAASTVFVINSPVVNSGKVSPNLVLNMIIALFVGLLLGINIAFLKAYWKKLGTVGTVLADRGEGSGLS